MVFFRRPTGGRGVIYGLYQSATGVLTNSYRQDVIANNLANAETVGFKRNLPLFHERLAEAIAARGAGPRSSDPMLDLIGGGLLVSPTAVDTSQGDLEATGNPLDIAIMGSGFFAVQDGTETRLTRDGRFMIDRAGNLVMANGSGNRVLDDRGRPIQIDAALAPQLVITDDGQISANGAPLARLGLFDVPNPAQLAKRGGTLLSYPESAEYKPATGVLQSGFVERSNVDPTLELTQLMDAQRQIEANANMIRYQDQTLGTRVNEVGKI
jgi:flagellar basal body rod protein FlgG